MARLARTLTTTSQLSVTDACNTLLATLARPADDIAILMARDLTPGPAAPGRTQAHRPTSPGPDRPLEDR